MQGVRQLIRGRPGREGRAGFTLIELLVVISIIMLLAALALPVLGKASALGREAACSSQMRQIGAAAATFRAQNEFLLPIHWMPADKTRFSTEFWVEKYGHSMAMWGWLYAEVGMQGDGSAFRCPSHRGPNKWIWEYSTEKHPDGDPMKCNPSYGWNLRLGQYTTNKRSVFHTLDEVPNPGEVLEVGETEGLLRTAFRGYMVTESPGSYYFARRHKDGGNALWLDGHVSRQKYDDMVSYVPGDRAYRYFWPKPAGDWQLWE